MPLVLQLFIRAFKIDVQEIHYYKQVQNLQHVAIISKLLSSQLLRLSYKIDNRLVIAGDCVLTAFSLDPTKSGLDRVYEIMPAITSTMVENVDFLDDETDMSDKLCQDLVILLNSERDSSLNWNLDWVELKNNCERYLAKAENNVNYSQSENCSSNVGRSENLIDLAEQCQKNETTQRKRRITFNEVTREASKRRRRFVLIRPQQQITNDTNAAPLVSRTTHPTVIKKSNILIEQNTDKQKVNLA